MRGIINYICKPLTFIGAINWGLVGLFGINLVYILFGAGWLSRIIYALIGIAAVTWIVWFFISRIK
ncbi:MAG: DUF378 domain-containing protein [Alphaproteobacteria bacterium]|nr:DUF378 domain-containing protein [Alphaproteobacteria bacterium]